MTDTPFLDIGSRHHRPMPDAYLSKYKAVRDCGSYEVWFDDGRPSKFFYFDDCLNGGCGRTS
jgi:hypothetical protein